MEYTTTVDLGDFGSHDITIDVDNDDIYNEYYDVYIEHYKESLDAEEIVFLGLENYTLFDLVCAMNFKGVVTALLDIGADRLMTEVLAQLGEEV